MSAFPSRGLYAITQCENKTPDDIINDVELALKGGAAVVQYRDKNPTDPVYTALALAQVCRKFDVPLIINDDPELCRQAKADGVHLGTDDHNIVVVRKYLGESAIIGVSCYNSLERALSAQASGANYVAFGRFFPSSSKPLAKPAEIATLHQAKLTIHLPIVAIGGILPENGGQLLAAGADLLAVIGGVFSRNPEHSALAFQPLFEN